LPSISADQNLSMQSRKGDDVQYYTYVPRVAPEQVDVGRRLGLDLSQDTWAVARARILDVVGPAIGDHERYRKPTEKQIAWAKSLGIDLTEESYRVAYAMIHDALWERENRLIEEMQLRPGDTVSRVRQLEWEGQIHEWTEERIISSIRDDGLLYFKGTGSRRGWPSKFTKVSR
jgi:hypothetical protein